MAIAGLVIMGELNSLASIQTKLNNEKSISSAGTVEASGRIPIVLEIDSKKVESEMARMAEWEGVLSVDLAFLSYEDEIAEQNN